MVFQARQVCRAGLSNMVAGKLGPLSMTKLLNPGVLWDFDPFSQSFLGITNPRA